MTFALSEKPSFNTKIIRVKVTRINDDLEFSIQYEESKCEFIINNVFTYPIEFMTNLFGCMSGTYEFDDECDSKYKEIEIDDETHMMYLKAPVYGFLVSKSDAIYHAISLQMVKNQFNDILLSLYKME